VTHIGETGPHWDTVNNGTVAIIFLLLYIFGRKILNIKISLVVPKFSVFPMAANPPYTVEVNPNLNE